MSSSYSVESGGPLLPVLVKGISMNEERPKDAANNAVFDGYNIRLRDILDVEAIRPVMLDLWSLTGMNVAIIDLEGALLIDTGWQDVCLKFHRANAASRKNCIESDTLLSAGVPLGEFKAYRCRNNLWDVATPIMVAGKHLGNLFIGQFFYDDEEVDYDQFRRQATEYGFDEERYLAAVDRVPRYSRHRVAQVMGLYAKLADMISSLSLTNMQLRMALAEHRKAEEELRRANAFLDSIIENIPLMVFLKDAEDLRFLRFNRAGEALLGRSRDDLIGKNDYDFFPREQAEFFIEKDREVLLQGTLVDIPEEPLESSGRGTRILHTLKVPVMGQSGEPEYLLGISEDITQRKQVEEALLASEALHKALAEENAVLLEQSRRDAEATATLLHEVNHRVKNNMMAVIGLLYAQRRFIAENLRADFQSAMTELAGRVETMALVHGMLSASKWGPLPMSQLFNEVMGAASKLVHYERSMEFSFVGEDARFPAQAANSLALLLFELATNTTKHALRAKERVRVRLSGRWHPITDSSDAADYVMTYSDDGPGFPPEVLAGQRSSLGIYLLRTLAAHDLRSALELRNDGGALVTLRMSSALGLKRISG